MNITPLDNSPDMIVISRRELRELIDKAYKVMQEMLPGVKKIALQRYDLLNEAFVEMNALNEQLKKLGA